MLTSEVSNNPQKLKKQIKGLEYQIKVDTNEKDKEIHEKALCKLLRECIKLTKDEDVKMKYYFVKDTEGTRHIVIAQNDEDLQKVLEVGEVESEVSYELKEDTFQSTGFLISDN